MKNRTSVEARDREGLLALSKLPARQRAELHRKVASVAPFTLGFLGVSLRAYQIDAAEAIARSVFARDGETFVVIFPRQSGKDELLADLILFLFARLAEKGASIVCAQPTFRPQALNAIDRLETRAMQRPFFANGGFCKRDGHTFRFGRARLTYLSADPAASVVGATAGRLLILNEAQDIQPSIYDKRFAPMAASGNATRVFSGTAWTGDTLLDREKQLGLLREKADGRRRVFMVDGDEVARSNPYYADFLKNEIARLGRDHPLIRTQFYCENIEARSRMFTPVHLSLMACPPSRADCHLPSPHRRKPGAESNLPSPYGRPRSIPERRRSPERSEGDSEEGAGGEGHPRIPSATSASSPIVNHKSEIVNPMAFLLDVAGQEESRMSTASSDEAFVFDSNCVRDAVTLRVVEIDLSTLSELHGPTYRALHLQQWVGQNHLTVFAQLKALAEIWSPQHIVIDATGVGEGLWAMLDKAFPTRVTPVKFTQGLKSELGYGFLAIINTGRFRDCCGYDAAPAAVSTTPLAGPGGEHPRRAPAPDSPAASRTLQNSSSMPHSSASGFFPTRAQIDREYAACESEVLIGPRKIMRWGVPEGRRDEDGRPIHDDIPVTDSLTAILDRLEWSIRFKTVMITPRDPLAEMSRIRDFRESA